MFTNQNNVHLKQVLSFNYAHKKGPRTDVHRVNALYNTATSKHYSETLMGVSTKYLVNYINWFLYLE